MNKNPQDSCSFKIAERGMKSMLRQYFFYIDKKYNKKYDNITVCKANNSYIRFVPYDLEQKNGQPKIYKL